MSGITKPTSIPDNFSLPFMTEIGLITTVLCLTFRTHYSVPETKELNRVPLIHLETGDFGSRRSLQDPLQPPFIPSLKWKRYFPLTGHQQGHRWASADQSNSLVERCCKSIILGQNTFVWSNWVTVSKGLKCDEMLCALSLGIHQSTLEKPQCGVCTSVSHL